ncbi:MAG: YggS family pyridoxal phosphate-dependent enzyme [Candidatus Omnitrophica bacterium]|nr:YggS family pyridoxal phosphate-dependent enzyme [Candidatus Omnitrophota bacterium]
MLSYSVSILKKSKEMIQENILRLKERITAVCNRLGRNPQEIKIVAITKNTTPPMIKQAIDYGINDIGENRVQDAISKFASLESEKIKFSKHMVGHLQTNKAKKCVEIFDLIQSVDSLKLASEINEQAEKINKIQNILIQVNTSSEVTKFGLKCEELKGFIREIPKFENLKVQGLMTIAPLVENPQEVRIFFKRLSELKDKINEQREQAENIGILSMGMTDDFEVAIEEGSNMIRVGRAIFGD